VDGRATSIIADSDINDDVIKGFAADLKKHTNNKNSPHEIQHNFDVAALDKRCEMLAMQAFFWSPEQWMGCLEGETSMESLYSTHMPSNVAEIRKLVTMVLKRSLEEQLAETVAS
jgi:hypothetical protein